MKLAIGKRFRGIYDCWKSVENWYFFTGLDGRKLILLFKLYLLLLNI
jgi:hypothetical protein